MSYLLNRVLRFLGFKQMYRPLMTEGARFIVFNPTWPDPPRFGFDSLEEAKKVAEMLAKKQPADDFFVLKSVLRISAVTRTTELPGGV